MSKAAIPTASTNPKERAVGFESTVRLERAVRKESTEPGERVEAAESTTLIERSGGGRRSPGTRAGLLRFSELPWITAADAAELEVLGHALIRGLLWHRERCPVARADDTGFQWCKHMSAAVEEVLEWRDLRERYSRARWLRVQLGA